MALIIKMSDTFSKKLHRKLMSASDAASRAVATQIAKDTEPFVPAQSKSLVNRTQVMDRSIVYPGPYAQFLYYGKLMIDPDTGSAWARKGATKVVTGTDLDIKKNVHGQAQSYWFEASKAQNKDKWIRIAERVVKREL